MITKSYGAYVIICDVCGEESPKTFDTFQDAIDGSKQIGWSKVYENGYWKDTCGECEEE